MKGKKCESEFKKRFGDIPTIDFHFHSHFYLHKYTIENVYSGLSAILITIQIKKNAEHKKNWFNEWNVLD